MIININDRYQIEIFYNETDAYPVFVNKLGGFPDGAPFESEEEARTWAEYMAAVLESETAPFPPQARGAEPLPRREIIAGIEHVWNAETETWDVVPEPEEEPSA